MRLRLEREREICSAGCILGKILRCARMQGVGPDVTHALRASQTQGIIAASEHLLE